MQQCLRTNKNFTHWVELWRIEPISMSNTTSESGWNVYSHRKASYRMASTCHCLEWCNICWRAILLLTSVRSDVGGCNDLRFMGSRWMEMSAKYNVNVISVHRKASHLGFLTSDSVMWVIGHRLLFGLGSLNSRIFGRSVIVLYFNVSNNFLLETLEGK